MTNRGAGHPGRIGSWLAALLALPALLGFLLSTNPVTADGELRILPGTRADLTRQVLTVPVATPGRYAVWATWPVKVPAPGVCDVSHEAGAPVMVRRPEFNIKWVEIGASHAIYTGMAEFTADTVGTYRISCAIPSLAYPPRLVVTAAPDVSGTLPARLRELRPVFAALLLLGLISAVATALIRRRSDGPAAATPPTARRSARPARPADRRPRSRQV